MTIYYYTKGPVAIGRLRDDIEADPTIVTALDYLTFRGPDNVEVSFSGTLSGAEESALGTVVSGHSGIHDPQPAVLPSGELDAEAMVFTDGSGLTRWATGFSTVVSGVDPTGDSDLTTKNYVDSTITGSVITDHGDLNGLLGDDHIQYILTDGTRELTGHWVTGSGIEVPYIQMDTSLVGTPVVARLQWNSEDGTLEYGLPGGNVILQVGQEHVIPVMNKSGAQINNGSVVYINGAQGDKPTIALASADGLPQSIVTGLATEDIPNNEIGYITTAGLVRGLDTNGLGEGSILYLDTISGAYTASRPASPNYTIGIGRVVTDSASNGSVLVRVTVIPKMVGLSDVEFNLPTTSGQFLRWNDTTTQFELYNSDSIDHSDLGGLENDDHLQYVPRDGIRGFTSTVSGVYPTENYHLTTREYVDYSFTTLSGQFGGYSDHVSSDNESATNSTTYVQKVRLTTQPVPSGVYRIGFAWEWRHSKSNTDFLGQVQIDDVDTIYTFSSSPIVDVNTWRLVSGFHYESTLSSGVHTIDVDYASSSTGSTSYIRNVEVEFWRVL